MKELIRSHAVPLAQHLFSLASRRVDAAPPSPSFCIYLVQSVSSIALVMALRKKQTSSPFAVRLSRQDTGFSAAGRVRSWCGEMMTQTHAMWWPGCERIEGHDSINSSALQQNKFHRCGSLMWFTVVSASSKVVQVSLSRFLFFVARPNTTQKQIEWNIVTLFISMDNLCFRLFHHALHETCRHVYRWEHTWSHWLAGRFGDKVYWRKTAGLGSKSEKKQTARLQTQSNREWHETEQKAAWSRMLCEQPRSAPSQSANSACRFSLELQDHPHPKWHGCDSRDMHFIHYLIVGSGPPLFCLRIILY